MMPKHFEWRMAAIASAMLILTACSTSPIDIAGRDKLKGTTKTQGDFNLANRSAQVAIDGQLAGEAESVPGLQGLVESAKVITDRDTGRAREASSGLATGRLTLRVEADSRLAVEFFKWRKAVLDGKVDRKSISIVFQNDAGEEAARYNFFECWPVRWKAPELNARNSAHATEQIEVVFERFELK
jgi:phage tail-like protein